MRPEEHAYIATQVAQIMTKLGGALVGETVKGSRAFFREALHLCSATCAELDVQVMLAEQGHDSAFMPALKGPEEL